MVVPSRSISLCLRNTQVLVDDGHQVAIATQGKASHLSGVELSFLRVYTVTTALPVRTTTLT